MKSFQLPKNPKIRIIGCPGTGKTTLAANISDRVGVRHFELDSFVWLEDWKMGDNEETLQIVSQKIADNHSWVMCGGYSFTDKLLLKECNILIYLNYPFYITFWRLLKRTLSYCWNKTLLWGKQGTYDTFYRTFCTKESILWVFCTLYQPSKAKFQSKIDYWTSVHEQDGDPNVVQLTFTHPDETAQWLNSLSKFQKQE
ncbi:hypothetical protein BC833DRAFT_622053 [Globomyces pollinis-pini]|nr:hypothetical protein BC833DRAFT_622053 [Globomyces pollinis-pini]